MQEVKVSLSGTTFTVIRVGCKWAVECEHIGRSTSIAGPRFWRRRNAEMLRDMLCRLADEAYWDTKGLMRRRRNGEAFLLL